MADLSQRTFDLSGEWEIAFDPTGQGLRDGWTQGQWPHSLARPIQVPAIWNIPYPDAQGVGYYRRAFAAPDEWRGKVVCLRFEGVIYRCEAWLNGAFIGSHEGGYTPFEFEVTRAVRPGAENVLVVRVAALSRSQPVDGMPIEQAPVSKQSWYYAFGGIWGQVTLETRPGVAAQHVWITPDLQNETARVEIGLHNYQADLRPIDLELIVRAPDGQTVFRQHTQVAAPPGLAWFSYPVHLPAPLPWSCEQPALYQLEVTTCGADGDAHLHTVPFGMRDFTVRDGQFFLNGDPIFVRGVLLQPYYPVHLIHHADHAEMAREIGLVKQAGFNLIRAHLHPAPPGYLDLADRMGVLVYAETCLGWIRESPRFSDHGRREIRALIERDRNHPSVVFWGIYNENPPADAANGSELALYARSLDPTRVVVRNSGASLAIDQDFGWIDRARVIAAREVEQKPILDVHLYLGAILPNPVYAWLQGLGSSAPTTGLAGQGIGSVPVFEEFDRERQDYAGKVFVSELGCGGMGDLDAIVAGFQGRDDLLDARELKTLRDDFHRGFAQRRLDLVFGSAADFFRQTQAMQAWGDTQQLEAVLTNPRASGYVITQWADVAWEFHAGILDFWRRPKLAYAALQRLNQPHCLVLRPNRTDFAPGDGLEVDVKLVSRQALPPNSQVQLTVRDPRERVIAVQTCPAPGQPGIHAIDRWRVTVGETAGEYRITAELQSDRALAARADESVWVLEPVAGSDLPAGIRFLGGTPPTLAAVDGEPRERDASVCCPVVVAASPERLLPADWNRLFEAVAAGSAAVIGPLGPEDRGALSELDRRGLAVRVYPGLGSWLQCCHWIPESRLFAGLPSGGLAGKAFVDVLPKYVLAEQGGQVLAGSLRNSQSRQETPAMVYTSDIEAVPFGSGMIYFCQYRVFDERLDHPLARRLALNLLLQAAETKP